MESPCPGRAIMVPEPGRACWIVTRTPLRPAASTSRSIAVFLWGGFTFLNDKTRSPKGKAGMSTTSEVRPHRRRAQRGPRASSPAMRCIRPSACTRGREKDHRALSATQRYSTRQVLSDSRSPSRKRASPVTGTHSARRSPSWRLRTRHPLRYLDHERQRSATIARDSDCRAS